LALADRPGRGSWPSMNALALDRRPGLNPPGYADEAH
jgi:hypothetical protein